MSKEKEPKAPKREFYPGEAEQAAHHLKMYHSVKADKDLHKAAKEHVKKEHAALGEVIGKKSEDKEPKKKPQPPKKKK
jgi:hypothetical protein